MLLRNVAFLLLFVPLLPATAAPFALTGPDEIRSDDLLTWQNFSTTDGDPVPSSTVFATNSSTRTATLSGGGNFTIANTPDLSTPGIHLQNSISAFTVSISGTPLQGIAFSLEHRQTTQASHTIRFFSESGTHLGTMDVSTESAARNSVFIGFIDPEARIRSFTIDSTPTNQIAISDLILQEKPASIPLESLPVASSVTLELDPAETYLHQGLSFFSRKSDETTTAVADNDNTFDLLALFPSLRTGDVIRFQRLGLSYDGNVINHTAAAFSPEQTLLAGDEIIRLRSVVPAGSPVITRPVKTGNVDIPTDIGGDFIVPSSAFITVPAGARYLFTTLQKPGGSAVMPNIRLSHIPRQPFLDWIASHGLVGPLADPDSDLDGDGLTLIEEFAYSKDPTISDTGAADFAFTPFLAETSPRLRFNIGVRRDAPLLYQPEYSSDLVNWTTLPESSLSSIATTADRAILTSSDPIGGPKRFARLRIQYIPAP